MMMAQWRIARQKHLGDAKQNTKPGGLRRRSAMVAIANGFDCCIEIWLNFDTFETINVFTQNTKIYVYYWCYILRNIFVYIVNTNHETLQSTYLYENHQHCEHKHAKHFCNTSSIFALHICINASLISSTADSVRTCLKLTSKDRHIFHLLNLRFFTHFLAECRHHHREMHTTHVCCTWYME